MKVLLIIDFINEIVAPDGKLSGKGYSDFMIQNNTFEKVNRAIDKCRTQNIPIIFINLGFESDYSDLPKNSPLFGKAEEFDILRQGTWSTEIYSELHIQDNDIRIHKSRVNAFYKTDLEQILKEMKITELYIAAVATDVAGEATARAAHDLDFNLTVLSDACAAANADDHKKSLSFITKIGSVMEVEKFLEAR